MAALKESHIATTSIWNANGSSIGGGRPGFSPDSNVHRLEKVTGRFDGHRLIEFAILWDFYSP
jgi:hypothetical protein